MACYRSPLEQHLSCPVCFDLFSDPVILSCAHSFCRTCIEQSWTESTGRLCPVCRHSAPEEPLLCNLALRNTCEFYTQQKMDRGSRWKKRKSDSDPQGVWCSVHQEKLSLFCVDHLKLLCEQCVIQDDQSHTFCFTNKASSTHKEKLQIHLKKLEKGIQTLKRLKVNSEEVTTQVKLQAHCAERQIKKEFEKLRKIFIKEDEPED